MNITNIQIINSQKKISPLRKKVMWVRGEGAVTKDTDPIVQSKFHIEEYYALQPRSCVPATFFFNRIPCQPPLKMYPLNNGLLYTCSRLECMMFLKHSQICKSDWNCTYSLSFHVLKLFYSFGTVIIVAWVLYIVCEKVLPATILPCPKFRPLSC